MSILTSRVRACHELLAELRNEVPYASLLDRLKRHSVDSRNSVVFLGVSIRFA